MGGLISIADGGSSGGGIARVLADIAPHSSNMTRGVFAQLQPLLCLRGGKVGPDPFAHPL